MGIVLDLFGVFLFERTVISMAFFLQTDYSRTTIRIMPHTETLLPPTSAPLVAFLLNSALGPAHSLALAAPSSENRRGVDYSLRIRTLGSGHKYALWC